jgi:putative DNA primase/helicase
VTRSVRRHGGALTIIPLDKATLVELLTSAARWQTFNEKAKEYRAINCPKTIAEGLLARTGNWRFPVLAGIAEAPYMIDGHIYSAPGYEPRTSAYLNSGDNEFPEIPKHPTRMEAKKALRILKEVVKDFPFVAEVDVSVWISALLTTFARLGLRSVPLFGFTATVMATGKSLLADLISIIATGRRTSVMSHVQDHNEERKRLLFRFGGRRFDHSGR